jgi:hypothetical protein
VSPGEVAVIVVAVSWAVISCVLIRALIRLVHAQQETARLVAVLAERVQAVAPGVTAAAHPAGRADPAETAEPAEPPAPAAYPPHAHPATAVVRAARGASTALTEVVEPERTPSLRTSRVAATLSGPVVKVAAFGHGVRRAMTDRNPRELERRARAQVRAERAARQAYWRRARA